MQAIAVCHDANTVHGDIKPANFLLKNPLKKGCSMEQAAGKGPWVKSIDFGCSQIVSPNKPLTKRYCLLLANGFGFSRLIHTCLTVAPAGPGYYAWF